jgi:hypothetical protein
VLKITKDQFYKTIQVPADQYIIDMHYSLPKNNPVMEKYLPFVDYLPQRCGGKTLVTIVDGIWAAAVGKFCRKMAMAPFTTTIIQIQYLFTRQSSY